MSTGRLYVGRLSAEASRADVEDFFGKLGKVRDVRLLNGFGFVEYDDARDAEDAIKDLNGKDFFGDRLMIEFAKAPRATSFEDRDRPRERRQPSKGYRISITDLAPGTTWQDLKDFARAAGNVIYAEVSRANPSEGVIEYTSSEDVDIAFKQLDGTDLNGAPIKLLDNLGGYNYQFGAGTGGPGGRGGGGGGYAPRGGDRGYDRGGDRGDYRRRDDYRSRDDRDRSPPRRRDDDYDRRDRAPPVPRDDRPRSRSRSPRGSGRY